MNELNYTSRINNARLAMQDAGIDTLLVNSDVDRYYLSGFRGTAGYLFINADTARLAVDFRYIEQAGGQAKDCEVVQIDGGFESFLPDMLTSLKTKSLGCDPDALNQAAYQRLNTQTEKIGTRLIAAAGLIAGLRQIKQPGEIELIAKAVDITVAAFRHVRDILRPGQTEMALAWEIEKFMRERGSEAMPFPVIVASGSNAAMPHAQPSQKPINAGETVVVDIGASVDGYTSDMTRTFCAGAPDERFNEIHDIVLRAQRTAFQQLKTGITGADADKIARDLITGAGYGANFGHALGHGIGLETHEAPRLGPRSSDIIENGMVVTIEPGIYLPGWGGIRIEDDVSLEDGLPRAFSEIGEL
jgi:Xaa-Pro aminopeptidase